MLCAHILLRYAMQLCTHTQPHRQACETQYECTSAEPGQGFTKLLQRSAHGIGVPARVCVPCMFALLSEGIFEALHFDFAAIVSTHNNVSYCFSNEAFLQLLWNCEQIGHVKRRTQTGVSFSVKFCRAAAGQLMLSSLLNGFKNPATSSRKVNSGNKL